MDITVTLNESEAASLRAILSAEIFSDAAEALRAGLNVLIADFQDDELREAIGLGLADVEAGRIIAVEPGDIEKIMLAAIRERRTAAE